MLALESFSRTQSAFTAQMLQCLINRESAKIRAICMIDGYSEDLFDLLSALTSEESTSKFGHEALRLDFAVYPIKTVVGRRGALIFPWILA